MDKINEMKLDCVPPIDKVIKASELYQSLKEKGIKIPDIPDWWNQDQSPDFYLGMFSAMRVFQSAVVGVENGAGDLERLQQECMLRLGEIATIIIDKYKLKGF